MPLTAIALPWRRCLPLGPALAVPTGAAAHGGDAPLHMVGTLAGWSGAWWMWLAIAVALVLYLRGVAAVWSAAGRGSGIGRGHAVAGTLGWLVLALALLSPLDALGARLFWVHMVQHEVMMLVAAPLLVVGRPLAAIAWGLPARLRSPVGLAVVRRSGLGRAAALLSRPFAAWIFHALALWAWHVPRLFEAALASAWVHDVQHATFFASALAFWASLLGRGRAARSGIAVISVFATMVHTSLLGALLALSDRAFYPAYAERATAFGLTALEDQQLGGLIMWVPGGAAYAALGLLMFASWLQRLDGGRRTAGT